MISGIDLTVSGSAVKKPNIMIRRLSEQAQAFISKSESTQTPRHSQHSSENTMSAPAKIGGSSICTMKTAPSSSTASAAKPTTSAQPTVPKSQPTQNPVHKPKTGVTPIPPPPAKNKTNVEKVLVKRDTTHKSVIPKTENTLERTSRQALYQKSMSMRMNGINNPSTDSEDTSVPEKSVLPLKNATADIELQEGELRGKLPPVSGTVEPPNLQFTMEYLVPSHKVRRVHRKRKTKSQLDTSKDGSNDFDKVPVSKILEMKAPRVPYLNVCINYKKGHHHTPKLRYMKAARSVYARKPDPLEQVPVDG